MKQNVGFADSFIRIILAIGIFLVWLDGGLTGIWGGIGILLAIIFLVTALISWCPIWSILGIRTRK
ncbi:MAG: DUF2892 domain-containing protein [Flavobacteriales bacterium]|nr:DUF2892 domain-containing protein [Flavobacteriales bacterium]